MAVSGLIMIGYLLAHMYGNLKVFAGRRRSTNTPTICARSASRCCRTPAPLDPPRRADGQRAGPHVRGVQPVDQGTKGPRRDAALPQPAGPEGSPADLRVLHLALGRSRHRTVRGLPPAAPDLECRCPRRAGPEPYDRVVNGFRIWRVVLAYTVAMVAVGFHLRHGVWSALTTLGANVSSLARKRLNAHRVHRGGGGHHRVPAAAVRDRLRAGRLTWPRIERRLTDALRRARRTAVSW